MTPEERFSEAFPNHVLTIEKEDGLYRSLLFKKPGCSMFWCRVVTWPNGLALTGDCGSFMVGHPAVSDILKWFPTDRDYLAGKIAGHGAHNSLYEYSVEMALEAVEAFRGYIFDAYPDPDDEDEEPEEMLPKHVQKLADLDELKADLKRGGVPEYELRERLLEIDSDSWEWSFRDLSWQFRFQCLAVDAIKAEYFIHKKKLLDTILEQDVSMFYDAFNRTTRHWVQEFGGSFRFDREKGGFRATMEDSNGYTMMEGSDDVILARRVLDWMERKLIDECSDIFFFPIEVAS